IKMHETIELTKDLEYIRDENDVLPQLVTQRHAVLWADGDDDNGNGDEVVILWTIILDENNYHPKSNASVSLPVSIAQVTKH
ncbi:unnamed protein product, partial [Candidula unifasciata]